MSAAQSQPARDAALAGRVREILAGVPDPEIPVVSVVDLGIVRGAHEEGGRLVVDVTPTYSGCPATEVIEADIAAALRRAGWKEVEVRRQLAPPWTTDWISEAGKRKLRAYGIAPPGPVDAAEGVPITFMRKPVPVPCPRCGSTHTERIAAFGSTACKALHRCLDCHEPFDHFKPI